MTNAAETASQLISLIQSLYPLVRRLPWLRKRLLRSFQSTPRLSYENELLELTLDLTDHQGRRATVTRRQRIRFLTQEVGVVACPIWGDGDMLDGYDVQGASKLGMRKEGSRNVLLIALPRRPVRNMRATISARRTIRNGFLAAEEYFESVVERPTRRLRLKVLFPKSRPPSEAFIHETAGDSHKRLRARVRQDGRALIQWSCKDPRQEAIYSLRWSW